MDLSYFIRYNNHPASNDLINKLSKNVKYTSIITNLHYHCPDNVTQIEHYLIYKKLGERKIYYL